MKTGIIVALNFTILLSICISVFAEEVDINTAQNVALNLYAERSGQGSKSVNIGKVIEEKENGVTAFYILIYDTKGFVIISADDAVRPILGYSFESSYDENNHSPAFEYFILKRLKKQIYAVIQAKQTPEPETVGEWVKYSASPGSFITDGVKNGFPLTRTLWDQDQYYNAQCPADPNGPDGHALVGCVATAMAQVLNYWQHPWHGTGSHSYTPEDHPEYGIQSADFSTAVYNFDNMPDTVNDYSVDLAELMYHCAVSVDMNFGPDGSGASGWGNNDISYALENYFYFNDAANDLNRSSYPGSLWTDLLNEELDLNRPIIYGANDSEQEAGHAWVIDAYTTGDMYHCNWGWSGSDNGWYLMDNFAVNGHVFDDYQCACVHIYPKNAHISGTWNLAGSPYYLDYHHFVDPGDVLVIEPGVEIIYNGRYKLEVRGRLDAQGNATDSIYFKSGWPEVGTRGVSFSNTNDYSMDSSRLAFCKFEDGRGIIADYILPDHLYGGSVSCRNSSTVSVLKCTITNSSASYGGAISCTENSAIKIAGCVISNDSASAGGGGIYCLESDVIFNRNVIQNNICAWSNGGGVSCYYSQATFDKDTICFNHAKFGAGLGLHNSDAVLGNVVIHHNEADVDGGGIYMGESSPELNGVHFLNNTADDLGGAILCYWNSNPVISRSRFNYNYADEGAAIAIVDAHPTLSHVTMVANNLAPDGEAVYVKNGSYTFKNSISWNNFNADIDTSGTCTITLIYSIIQNGPWTGTGVLKKDPLFVDPWISDYHLRWDGYPLPDENKSPAIDNGDPGTPFDPDGTRADMGVYPFNQTYTPLPGGNINGTLTCDGSPYFVSGNLTVPATEELVIEPCISLIFTGDYRLEVRGRLLAEGTEANRINFACSDTVTGWQGIRFINTNTNGQDSSVMDHCRITFGNANGSSEYAKGGAIYFSNSGKVRVSQCLINKNKASDRAGGIYISGTPAPLLKENIIENNQSPLGGGLFLNSSTVYLADNFVQHNLADKAGGIYVYYTNFNSAGNTIRYNRADLIGGGIWFEGSGSCTFNASNKSSVYMNYAGAAGLDFYSNGYGGYVNHIVLDTFTVQIPNKHFAYPFQYFDISNNSGFIEQTNSDLYISMTGSDENDGTSSASPLKTMHMACLKIIADADNPHTIHLAAGTYSEGATGEVFPINWRSYVSLKGAGIDETIIYGEEKNQLFYSYNDNGYTIDSLTFQGGYGEYGGAMRIENYSSPVITKVEIKNNYAEKSGGGIYCETYSNPSMYDIKVHDNTVEEHGGGMMFYSHCNPTVKNSMIYDNFALYNGGGIACRLYCNPQFDSLTIYQNTAVQGGGLNFNFTCSGSVSNSLIQGNQALTHVPGYSGNGGGVWIYYISSPSFTNVTFKQNYAQNVGGGIHAYAQTYSVYKNCIFEGNTANTGGAAYLNGANNRFVNTIISNNSTVNGSGGAIASISGSPTFTNVTITQNSANGSGHGGALYNFSSYPQFTNSILWNNSPEEITVSSGSVSAQYCDIEGYYTGTGNISEDPLFEWSYNGQYDLGEGSPCIDAGTPDTTGLSLPEFDLAGNPRISNGIVDIGAHEFQNPNSFLLNLKAFLEGPFSGSVMNANLAGSPDFPLTQPYNAAPWNYGGTENVVSVPAGVVDWILVELRDAPDAENATGATTVARQAAFLMNNGNIRSLNGFTSLAFNNTSFLEFPFVVIKHRNHLAVLSANPVTESDGVYPYDFTTGATQAYGNGQKEITPGVWGLFAGDANSNGAIDPTDLSVNWVSDAANSGYLTSDFNLDSQADNKDKNDFWVNTGTSSPLPFECGFILSDERDGQTYNTIQIGTQCWMAENLNIGDVLDNSGNQTDNAVIEKYCYNDISDNCDVYGGLYQWDEMMQYITTEGTQGICPDGWHLPAEEEWCILENEVDIGSIECSILGWRGTDAGGNLKESGTSHWYAPNTGATNASGFTGLPGGVGYTSGYYGLSADANFWTSSEVGSNVWIRQLSYDSPQVNRYGISKNYGLSVRCLKN